MGGLTEEQKRRIEENKRKALQRRAQSAAQKSSSTVTNQLYTKQQVPQGLGAKVWSSGFNPSTASKAPVQSQPVKWVVPPSANSKTQGMSNKFHTSTNPSSFNSSGSVQYKPQNSKTEASAARIGSELTSSTKDFTSIHPPSSTSSSSSFVPFKGQNSNLVGAKSTSSTSSSSSFVPFKGQNSNLEGAKNTSQFYNKSISKDTANSGQSSNKPTSYHVSKPSSTFYSSKTATSNTSKPSFSSYGKKNNTFSQNSSQQKPWQKSQAAFGAGASSGTPGSVLGGGMTGKCVLASRTRFLVDVAFHAKLIEIFKQMSTKSYDAATKRWSFSLSEYDELIQAVKCLRPAVEIEPLPRSITIAFRNQRKGRDAPRNIPDANLNSIDSTLVTALMPFQRDGVNFAVAHEGRVLIADDMGLGKTVQAICIAYYYRTEWPLLIVTPSSLRYSWAEAIEKWLPSLDPDSINVVLTGKDKPTAGLVNIMSYDLMARQVEKVAAAGFQVIILDESHFMKNIKTARAKAALAIVKNAPRVMLLSGTPALSRPSELYTQVKAVRPNLFSSTFHDFGVRYCDGKQGNWGWDYSGSSNLSELQLLLEETIMIRRLKSEVLTQLPSKTRQMVLMDPQSVKTSSKALKNAAKEMSQKKKSEQRGALMQYFNETGHAKIPAIKDYVADLLECGCKTVVFAHHQLVLNAICECVKSKKQGYIRIDGSTSAANRKHYVDTFQTDDSCRIAVLSITAANAGFTMTASSLVVFAELFWNPGIMIQAEDRVHRIGQKDCVNIRYLIAKGTADDYIWPLIKKKLTVLEEAGLSKDDFSKADTTTFQDPRQRTILSFFEQSFFEEDEDSAAAELAALEAAEADGIASQPPEGDGIASQPLEDEPVKHCLPKKKLKEMDKHDTWTEEQSGKNNSESTSNSGTHIKRLAKSTVRKFDQWKKVETKAESHDELVEDDFFDELAEDFDLDSAVLDSDEDSPSLLNPGKRQKTQIKSRAGFVPPYKKPRNK